MSAGKVGVGIGFAAFVAGVVGAWHAVFPTPTPEAAAHRRIEGKTDGCLWACVSNDHMCRCDCVCEGRSECVDAGLEENCVFDQFEDNRSEPGCQCARPVTTEDRPWQNQPAP